MEDLIAEMDTLLDLMREALGYEKPPGPREGPEGQQHRREDSVDLKDSDHKQEPEEGDGQDGQERKAG